MKYAFMSTETFATFTETEEVQKTCASFAANALGVQQTPSLEQANTALRGLSYLYGLQIIVIDQDITIELGDGSRPFSGNPFVNDVVMFSASKVFGHTFRKRPADLNVKGSVALKTLNGHTLIKKFANEEPLEEVTMGIANAFPAWETSSDSWLMSTDANTWNH